MNQRRQVRGLRLPTTEGLHGEGERTMNRDRRSSSHDPTDEPTSDQSTQSASGLSGGQTGPGVERNRELDRNDTPRRYDQPIEDDGDPVMPDDDATVKTKI